MRPGWRDFLYLHGNRQLPVTVLLSSGSFKDQRFSCKSLLKRLSIPSHSKVTNGLSVIPLTLMNSRILHAIRALAGTIRCALLRTTGVLGIRESRKKRE